GPLNGPPPWGSLPSSSASGFRGQRADPGNRMSPITETSYTKDRTLPGRAISQPIDAFSLEAPDPFGDGLRRAVEPARGGSLAEPALQDGAHHLLSTFRGQQGILVSVHSVLRESLVF